MRIYSRYFNDELSKLYNLIDKIDEDNFVYCEVKLGMYGSKQASILAYIQLRGRLIKHGYAPIKESTGLWKHTTKKTIFALCIDDFGIKYYITKDAEHLISSLHKYYEISNDWEGTNYCGLTFNWNHDKGYIDVSLPNYVEKAFEKFQHPKPAKLQYAPHRWNQPVYGRCTQYALVPDPTDKLDKKGQ